MNSEDPAYFRSLPPYVHTTGDLAYRRRHIWTDDHGIVQGLIDLDAVRLTFHDPAQVSALIEQLETLRQDMGAQAARAEEEEGGKP